MLSALILDSIGFALGLSPRGNRRGPVALLSSTSHRQAPSPTENQIYRGLLRQFNCLDVGQRPRWPLDLSCRQPIRVQIAFTPIMSEPQNRLRQQLPICGEQPNG